MCVAIVLAIAAAAGAAAQSPITTDERPDRHVFVRLAERAVGVTTFDVGERPTSAEALQAAFAASLDRLVTADSTEDATPMVHESIGRIRLVTIGFTRRGEPIATESRGATVVVADQGCRFVLATVAHLVFDFERNSSRIENGAFEVGLGTSPLQAAQVLAVRPEYPPQVARGRTERDLAFLLVRKSPPCEARPPLALFFDDAASALASLPATRQGYVRALCPSMGPGMTVRARHCAMVVLTAPQESDAATDSVAFNSCPGAEGDSGCPLVYQTGGHAPLLLGLQAQALHPKHPDALPVIRTLTDASRAPLLSAQARHWIDELLAQPEATGGPEPEGGAIRTNEP